MKISAQNAPSRQPNPLISLSLQLQMDGIAVAAISFNSIGIAPLFVYLSSSAGRSSQGLKLLVEGKSGCSPINHRIEISLLPLGNVSFIPTKRMIFIRNLFRCCSFRRPPTYCTTIWMHCTLAGVFVGGGDIPAGRRRDGLVAVAAQCLWTYVVLVRDRVRQIPRLSHTIYTCRHPPDHLSDINM